MARTNIRYRVAFNQMLDHLADTDPGTPLPSEAALAETLGVSRTIVRTVLDNLRTSGLILWDGREKRLIRQPQPDDRLSPHGEHVSLQDLEARFLEWILRFDVPAGTPLNVAQLAKQFGVAPHVLQEFLARLGNFGLVDRRPRGGWLLKGFTPDYAVELTEFRLMLESNAVRQFASLPPDHPAWAVLEDLEMRHRDLLARIETDFHDFSRLDGQFHAAINQVVHNRFVNEFQKVISLIFHYHYQWDKRMERFRNEAAINEHLHIIATLRHGDPGLCEQAMRAHLATAMDTLLSSLRVNNLAQSNPSTMPE